MTGLYQVVLTHGKKDFRSSHRIELIEGERYVSIDLERIEKMYHKMNICTVKIFKLSLL